MPKTHVKKGEDVVVIAGSEKGRRGKILHVNKKSQRVLVEASR
jgi:large subunit ribosomal protein L24